MWNSLDVSLKCGNSLSFAILSPNLIKDFDLQEDDIPLFLGADILAASNTSAKNRCRIHSRYAKTGLASKVTFDGNATVSRIRREPVLCSDITNTLVGISGETVPEGGNLCIYYVQSCHLVSSGSKFTAGVSHHTTPLVGGVGSTQ